MQFIEGQKIEHTFSVTEDVYFAFQKCSGDMNPLHTDENFAKSKGFPERVMYGNILNAFLSCFIGEYLGTDDVIIHSQEIAFKNPVFLNDDLMLCATVDGVYESVGAVEFSYKFIKSSSCNIGAGKVAAKGKFQIGILQK